MCGSGAGTFLIAPLMSSLLDKYGWRMCNRVMSVLCLSCAVYGLVMRPNRKKRQTVTEENNNTQTEQPQNRTKNILRDLPFLLMTLANVPNAMAIYIGYTYLPGVCVSYTCFSSSSYHSLQDGRTGWLVIIFCSFLDLHGGNIKHSRKSVLWLAGWLEVHYSSWYHCHLCSFWLVLS